MELLQKFIHTFLSEAFLVDIHALLLFLPVDEVLLGVRSDLLSRTGTNELLYLSPVLAIELNGTYKLLMLFVCPSPLSAIFGFTLHDFESCITVVAMATIRWLSLVGAVSAVNGLIALDSEGDVGD